MIILPKQMDATNDLLQMSPFQTHYTPSLSPHVESSSPQVITRHLNEFPMSQDSWYLVRR